MSVRVLGLGNDLLADDGFGPAAAAALAERFAGQVETVASATSGFDLLDDVVGVSHLLVVDTLATGRSSPGTVYEIGEHDLVAPSGASPHYVGLFEALRLGRALGLAVPNEVAILAVEPEDALTVGGAMSETVRDAIDVVLLRGGAIINRWLEGGSAVRDCHV